MTEKKERLGGIGAKLLMALGGIALLVALVVGGLMAKHYATTPEFEAYLVARPVADAVWRARALPGGEPPVKQEWFGVVDPSAAGTRADHELAEVNSSCMVGRDGKILLLASAQFQGALDPHTNDLRGLRVHFDVSFCDPRMRPIVVVNLDAPPDADWGTTRADVSAHVDFMAVAGPGPPELIVVRARKSKGWVRPALVDYSAMPWTILLNHTLGSPPPQGIIHHAQARVFLDWEKTPGGRSGPGFGEIVVAPNDDQYSWRYSVGLEAKGPGGSNAAAVQRRQDIGWMGEVW